MTRLLRYFLLTTLLAFTISSVSAQQASTIRGQHQVKKKETIFGISREYGLTIEELVKANPEMNTPNYELKKGMILNIPFPKDTLEAWAKREAAAKQTAAVEARKGGKAFPGPLLRVCGLHSLHVTTFVPSSFLTRL